MLDRTIRSIAERRKTQASTARDDAETKLLMDQRWEIWTAELEGKVASLRHDVEELKKELANARAIEAELRILVRRIFRWALVLRDELMKGGIAAPAMPDEIEDALATFGL